MSGGGEQGGEGREEGEGLGGHGTKGWVMRVSTSGGLREEGEERGVRKGRIGDVDRFFVWIFGVHQGSQSVEYDTWIRKGLHEGADLGISHPLSTSESNISSIVPFAIGSMASIK